MTEAFVFDAIRTPRGKGNEDGSLHEVKAVNLPAGLLTQMQQRHDLDTAKIDAVVMGLMSPVGEQGSVIAKVAALKAGWDFRCSGVQLKRLCASGVEAMSMAAQKVRCGWEDLVVAGSVECMNRVEVRNLKRSLSFPMAPWHLEHGVRRVGVGLGRGRKTVELG